MDLFQPHWANKKIELGLRKRIIILYTHRKKYAMKTL
jgi:hypothetical protein